MIARRFKNITALGLVTVVLAMPLIGCLKNQHPAPLLNNHFQIISFPEETGASSNSALVLDSQTGDLWYWTGDPNSISFRYMGRSVPGAKPGDLVAEMLAKGDQPPINLLKNGIVTTFKNGQKWTLRNGQPVKVIE